MPYLHVDVNESDSVSVNVDEILYAVVIELTNADGHTKELVMLRCSDLHHALMVHARFWGAHDVFQLVNDRLRAEVNDVVAQLQIATDCIGSISATIDNFETELRQ